MKYLLPVLIAIAALLVSGTAAFYSVTGLGKLFAGASIPVMVMAASLEFSKLVTASLLYRYWTTLGKVLKTYLTVAVTVLILITSLGIYGFLTAAYQQTSGDVATVNTEINLYETQKSAIQVQIDNLTSEKTQLAESISDLRSGLSKNVITYTDSKGNVLTSTSSATRTALEKQLASSTTRQSELDRQLSELTPRLLDLQSKITQLQVNLISTGELGPLQYISTLSGLAIDQVVNYLVLVIVLVFDPLAIALVIAANFAFTSITSIKEDEKTPDDVSELPDIEIVEKLPEAVQTETPPVVEEIKPPVIEVVQTPVQPVKQSGRPISRNAPAESSGKRYL